MTTITFKQFLSEAVDVVGVKAGHMTHAEDLVFDLGVEGTRKAIFFMRDVRDMLTQGQAKSSNALVTVKFDGAPALVVGVNPENGQFFVAKKGIFNKNPKLYYSHADIDADTSGELADKLKTAFTECSKLGIKSGVYQGDIMFTAQDLKRQNIDGKNYLTFHPNTIVYAVDESSELGKKIAASNIGIVWHTTYTGNTIASLTPSFGAAIASTFKKSSTSWMEDATYKDVSGAATFTAAERKRFDAIMSDVGRMFQRMPAAAINAIHQDKDLLTLVHTYNNSKIRTNTRVTDVKAHVEGLYQFIAARYAKEADALKTPAAKERKNAARDKVLNFFAVYPRQDIEAVFALSLKLATAKSVLVDKMNRVGGIETFVKTKDGFRVTGAEGFVAISDAGAVKLVDRYEFSTMNFSPDVLKGWTK